MADIFDIQEQVSKQIVDALRVHLSPSEESILTKRATLNPEAYDLFLRGRDFLYKLTRTNLLLAVQLFEQAIAKDPSYASAHAGIGAACATLYQMFDRKQEWLDRAIEASLRALIFDASVSEAYSSLGQAYFSKRDFAPAIEASRKAVALAPDNFMGYWVIGRVYFDTDRFPEALEAFEKVVEINPEFYSAYSDIASTSHRMGDLEREKRTNALLLEYFPEFLARHPDDARAHMMLGIILSRFGRLDEARAEGKTAVQLCPDDPLMLYNIACLYASLGEKALSIETLGQAIAAGNHHFDWMKRDPDLDPIRSEPAYVALMEGR
jgi:tetratricopeptide (TPR) repeat protein